MKLLLISDGHGDTAALDALEPVAAACDAVLFAGDFAKFGHPDTGKPFLERLGKLHDQVFAVTGNCDAPDFRGEVEALDLSVEGTLAYFSGLLIGGSGGALRHHGATPNEREDEELASDLSLAAGSAEDVEADDGGTFRDNLIVIAHQPPKDTLADLVPSGAHVGSAALRSFIDSERPLLYLCGHIHEASSVDRAGPTVVVNPGALNAGQYAVAELTGGRNVPFAVASVKLESLKK